MATRGMSFEVRALARWPVIKIAKCELAVVRNLSSQNVSFADVRIVSLLCASSRVGISSSQGASS